MQSRRTLRARHRRHGRRCQDGGLLLPLEEGRHDQRRAYRLLRIGTTLRGDPHGAASIDGQTADICTLRVSSCVASAEFSTKNCAPTGAPDDALCGVAAPIDAKCIQVTASSAYRCTMTCISDE